MILKQNKMDKDGKYKELYLIFRISLYNYNINFRTINFQQLMMKYQIIKKMNTIQLN